MDLPGETKPGISEFHNLFSKIVCMKSKVSVDLDVDGDMSIVSRLVSFRHRVIYSCWGIPTVLIPKTRDLNHLARKSNGWRRAGSCGVGYSG